MRVLVVNLHFAPFSFGGATIVAEEMVRGLRARGHDVLVFAGLQDPSMEPLTLHRYEHEGVPVVGIKLPMVRLLEEQYTNPELADRFGLVLQSFRPDVVHVHAVQVLGVDLVERAVDRGIPTVVTLHDAWWLCERQFMIRETGDFCGTPVIDPTACAGCVQDVILNSRWQARSRDILSRVDLVLTPSDYWRDFMVGNGLPVDRLRTNRNGVRLPAPDWRRPEHDGPVRLAFVGGTGPIKGSSVVRDALVGLGRRDYVLKVVDNTMNLGVASMSTTDWPVPGRVEIVPAYDQAGLDDFFGGVDVLLFPSQWKESFGLTVREASIRGAWVVSTDCGGGVEDLLPGENATVVPLTQDPVPLRRAIQELLEKPDRLRGRLPAASGIRGFSDQVDELQAWLGDLAAANGAPRRLNDEVPW